MIDPIFKKTMPVGFTEYTVRDFRWIHPLKRADNFVELRPMSTFSSEDLFNFALLLLSYFENDNEEFFDIYPAAREYPVEYLTFALLAAFYEISKIKAKSRTRDIYLLNFLEWLDEYNTRNMPDPIYRLLNKWRNN